MQPVAAMTRSPSLITGLELGRTASIFATSDSAKRPPRRPGPAGAMAVQELRGGRFGEMSTLMNYTFQSFSLRGRRELRPLYDLIANIAAEEYGHIEAV